MSFNCAPEGFFVGLLTAWAAMWLEYFRQKKIRRDRGVEKMADILRENEVERQRHADK